HSHAFHRALRGTTHADGGSFWTWRVAMYGLAERLTPESYRTLATAVFAEMALAGFTVVGEFHYLHRRPDGSPYAEPTALADAVLAAAADAGIRITLLDTLYLHGGLDADGRLLPLGAAQRRFADPDVASWAERHGRLAPGPLARIGAAVHSVRAVDPESLAGLPGLLGEQPVHAHVSEQPAENAQVAAAYGRTPLQVLADAGLITDRFTAVHATHLADADVALLADARATACICPTTEADLADGIGPVRRLADAGVPLALGTDQHVRIDPFEELQRLEADQRLASGERGRLSPGELLAAATRGGYRSLGWGGGTIEIGAPCDLVAVATASPRTAGARLDQLHLAASAADVTDVVVGGTQVVTGGRHRLGDVGALLDAAIAAVREEPR
ncbi:MAG TPA: formimidoylglutamate deiminase, partial [Amnibacterium sp.]|nr:formimidoylglutamate deiminase [Amnibacterium sp.]